MEENIWPRKEISKVVCYDLETIVQDSICIPFTWRHSVGKSMGQIGSRGEKICPEQVMSDVKTDY